MHYIVRGQMKYHQRRMQYVDHKSIYLYRTKSTVNANQISVTLE